jgi:hypothetical protein
VAALVGGSERASLVIGDSGGVLRPPFAAARFTAPTFDPAGDVFVVGTTGSQSRLAELARSGKLRLAVLPLAVRRQRITDIAISRDGSRIAMVVGPPDHAALLVGTIATLRDRPAIRGISVVVPAAQAVSGVAWAGADEIVTTVRRSADRRAVLTTAVDGYQPDELDLPGLPGDPTQVAAAPGRPLLAAADGEIWSLSGRRWIRASTGSDPSYLG